MKKIINLLILSFFVSFPFLSFAYSTIPGCTSPSGMSTLTGESCATAVIAPVIKVVAPDSAESLERGSTYVIKWTSDNSKTSTGLASITFVDEVSGTSNFITQVKRTDGIMNSYSWTIPSNIALGKYRVVILNDTVMECSATNDGCFYDKSDVPFNIIEKKPPAGTSISLLSPNGGEQITAGTFLKIHWKQASQYHMWPTAQVFLVGVSGPLAGSKRLVADYVERFPDDRGASVYVDPSTPPGIYRVRIEDVDFSQIFDESDAPVNIVVGTKTTQFSLITPNGGESWQIGETYKLKWKVIPSQEKIKSISLSFFDENLTQYRYSQPNFATSSNSGVMDFTVPIGSPELEPDLPPGKYRVAIGLNCAGWFAEYDAMKNGCLLFGVSAKPFTITAADTTTKISKPSATSKAKVTPPTSISKKGTTTATLPEITSTISEQSIVVPTAPTPTPEPAKKGFWRSISCFFSGLFGGVCK
ncbi:MAG: hypothetical protein Q7K40_05470 [bacterium]|nr:hypothetical protein [bacterium]